MDEKIKVASNSPVYGVAGAIAGTYRTHGKVEVQAIGAGAVNQAVKAIIHAQEFLAEDGESIAVTPSFVDLEIDDRELTAIHLHVKPELDFDENPTEVTEVVPVDTGKREGANYLLEEETAMDLTAVIANAEAITDKIDRYTTSDAIQEDFAQRQRMAPSGRAQLAKRLDEHHAESPTLSGGDIDAQWDQSGIGEETVGGTAPTPDQDVVSEIGAAAGLTYEEGEPLDPDKISRRDKNRWELNPDSVEPGILKEYE